MVRGVTAGDGLRGRMRGRLRDGGTDDLVDDALDNMRQGHSHAWISGLWSLGLGRCALEFRSLGVHCLLYFTFPVRIVSPPPILWGVLYTK